LRVFSTTAAFMLKSNIDMSRPGSLA